MQNLIKSYKGYEMDWNDKDDYISIIDYTKELGVTEEEFFERFWGRFDTLTIGV